MSTFALAAFDACAADYPTFGAVYSQQEDAYLTYSCAMQQDQSRLRCDFKETSVRKKARPEDLEKKLAEARKTYPSALEGFSDPKQCGALATFFEMATGRISIDAALGRHPEIASDRARFGMSITQLKDAAKSSPDILDSLRAIVGMCDDPSEDNYLKMTRAIHAKDLRTCTIGSQSFAQDFAWVSNFGNGGAWVVSAQPEGSCGMINLSRFEKDQSGVSGLFWRYIAREVSTNPSGTIAPEMSCSTLDEAEHVYDWRRTRSDFMQCNFVEFSPF